MDDGPAAIELSADDVARLVDRQHPRFSGPVALESRGWDSATFRLGEKFAARLPRRREGVALVANEQRWLVELAPHLPVPVPAALAIGRPSVEYPWPWSVVPWFDGRPADRVSASIRQRCADELADFLLALHRQAPDAAPRNDYRGTPLVERDVTVREHLAALGELGAAAESVWADAVTAPGPASLTWTHGDLHPGNVILEPNGSIAAVIDFGDMSRGDPAVDLAAAWLFFERPSRRRFQQRLDDSERYDPDAWRRARGWAVAFSVGLITESDGSDRMTGLGWSGLEAIAAEQ